MFVLVVDSVIEDDNIVPILVKPVDNVETTTEDDESFFTPLGKYLSFHVLQTFIKESMVMYSHKVCCILYGLLVNWTNIEQIWVQKIVK